MGRDNLMFAEVEAAGGDDPHIITREHIEVVREGLDLPNGIELVWMLLSIKSTSTYALRRFSRSKIRMAMTWTFTLSKPKKMRERKGWRLLLTSTVVGATLVLQN